MPNIRRIVIPSIKADHFALIVDTTKASHDNQDRTVWDLGDGPVGLYLIHTDLPDNPRHPFKDRQYTLQLRKISTDYEQESVKQPKAYKTPGSNPPPPDQGFQVYLHYGEYLDKVVGSSRVDEEEQVFRVVGSEPLIFVVVPDFADYVVNTHPPTGKVHTLHCPH